MPIDVTSEIMPLKKVLLHRPGKELEHLVPESLERLLFDDIPYLKAAQQEHDAFAKILKENGVEVVYLEDLVSDVLEDECVKDKFLKQFIDEAGIKVEKYKKIVYNFLCKIKDTKTLTLKTMEGLHLKELNLENAIENNSLVDILMGRDQFITDPMPNLYFTRDPFASIGNGISLNKMYSVTRNRETIYAEYIFKYHKDFKIDVKKYTDRYSDFNIEGGDILNLNKNILAVGISQRTSPEAIEELAISLFFDNQSQIDTVLAFDIPSSRAFMHLDTVFTQIDYNKFTVHPGILGPLRIYEITKSDENKKLKVVEVNTELKELLEKYLNVDNVELIQCGGGDKIAAEREQWNDGSNTLCISPGVIIVYERNTVTNELLREKGLKVLEMPSSEISRGRGGPRCMSMPLIRGN
ncbi:MAG: arginine deiminase [Oscillospiraceae bacterium]